MTPCPSMDGDPQVSFQGSPPPSPAAGGGELGALATSAQPSLLLGDENWNKRSISLESQA